MLYDAYEVQRSLLAGASKMASMGAGWLNNPANPFSYGSVSPVVAASLDVFAHAAAPRGKPELGIHQVAVGRKLFDVSPPSAVADDHQSNVFWQVRHRLHREVYALIQLDARDRQDIRAVRPW